MTYRGFFLAEFELSALLDAVFEGSVFFTGVLFLAGGSALVGGAAFLSLVFGSIFFVACFSGAILLDVFASGFLPSLFFVSGFFVSDFFTSAEAGSPFFFVSATLPGSVAEGVDFDFAGGTGSFSDFFEAGDSAKGLALVELLADTLPTSADFVFEGLRAALATGVSTIIVLNPFLSAGFSTTFALGETPSSLKTATTPAFFVLC